MIDFEEGGFILCRACWTKWRVMRWSVFVDVAELNKLAPVHDFDEDRRICEAEYKKWLSYYDADGYLRTDANKDPSYNASMRYVPIRLTD